MIYSVLWAIQCNNKYVQGSHRVWKTGKTETKIMVREKSGYFFQLFFISVTLSGNIIRSAILAGNITSDCGPIGHHNILAGNITSDCGPLGRHNRATMFRACSVTIVERSRHHQHVSCWRVLSPWIRSYMPNQMYDKSKRFVSVNSPIPAK